MVNGLTELKTALAGHNGPVLVIPYKAGILTAFQVVSSALQVIDLPSGPWYVNTRVGSAMNLRELPDLQSQIMITLPRGTEVTIDPASVLPADGYSWVRFTSAGGIPALNPYYGALELLSRTRPN